MQSWRHQDRGRGKSTGKYSNVTRAGDFDEIRFMDKEDLVLRSLGKVDELESWRER
jgi:hypothetical protein